MRTNRSRLTYLNPNLKTYPNPYPVEATGFAYSRIQAIACITMVFAFFMTWLYVEMLSPSHEEPMNQFGKYSVLKLLFLLGGIIVLVAISFTEAIPMLPLAAAFGCYSVIYPLIWLLQLTKYGAPVRRMSKAVPMHIKLFLVRHDEFTMLCLGESVLQVRSLFL
jgi:hypothetical protein